MARKHVTSMGNNNEISSSYGIVYGESKKTEIPASFRGFAGVLVSDHRVPPSQTTFYASTAQKALDAAIDHLVNLPGNKMCRKVIEDGIDLL
jgi:hypothetical protein